MRLHQYKERHDHYNDEFIPIEKIKTQLSEMVLFRIEWFKTFKQWYYKKRGRASLINIMYFELSNMIKSKILYKIRK